MIYIGCDKYRGEIAIVENGSVRYDYRLRRRRLGLERWVLYGLWLIIIKIERKVYFLFSLEKR